MTTRRAQLQSLAATLGVAALLTACGSPAPTVSEPQAPLGATRTGPTATGIPDPSIATVTSPPAPTSDAATTTTDAPTTGAPTTTEAPTTDAPTTDATAEPTQTEEPTATGPAPLFDGKRCSPELIEFMSSNSTTRASDFTKGFGLPSLIKGLDVGCTVKAKSTSLMGYKDTYAVVKNKKGVLDTLDRRIVAMGYTRDPLVAGVFSNEAGDPEGFIGVLTDDIDSYTDDTGVRFAHTDDWILVQFYLPGD